MANKKPTIKDIAKKASVSEATVSRFLNGKYEFMSADTRRRIEKIVKELNYQPNNIARTLKSKKSNVIGAIISDIENPFSNRIIKGLSDRADELGYILMITVSNNSAENERKYIQRFLNNGVDGLIVNTAIGNEEYLKEISKELPVVLLDRELMNHKLDVVTSNNYELGQAMTQHLLDSQFKSIGYFTGPIENNSVRLKRFRSFNDTVQGRSGIVIETYTSDIHEKEKLLEFIDDFRQKPAPRAIYASNGVLLLKLIQTIKAAGYEIPEDFGICGFDDWEWSTITGKTGITAIKQESYLLGVEACSLLARRIEEGVTGHPIVIEIPGTLNIRGSTSLS